MSAVVRIDLQGSGSICAAARRLLAEGAPPDALALIYRGETLCFNPVPLSTWARLTTEVGERSIRFRAYRPPMGRRVGAKPAGAAEPPPDGEGATQGPLATLEAV